MIVLLSAAGRAKQRKGSVKKRTRRRIEAEVMKYGER